MIYVTKVLIILICGFLDKTFSLWNNLNCPAPRSPENGLSFIFRNGELVHFRCHPGFIMRGKPVAYCVNNEWTSLAPECVSIEKDNHYYGGPYYNIVPSPDVNYYSHEGRPESIVHRSDKKEDINNSLFDWENKTRKRGIYGDGPRRLPLINGIWPNRSIQVMALGPRSTPGPMELVREEINIAELRNKQYEEVASQRAMNPHLDLLPAKKNRRNKKHRKNRKTSLFNKINNTSSFDNNLSNRETLVTLGSRGNSNVLSVALAKNESNMDDRHRYRHQDTNQKPKRRKSGHKKNRKLHYHQLQENIISRPSRVDTSGLAPYDVHYRRQRPSHNNNLIEFRRRPILEVNRSSSVLNLSEFDGSCVESFYGRDLPMIAPQVPHSYVYRYETKKNKNYPFNTYMQVKYRCLNGFSFADTKVQVLHCREAAWVGQIPRCVKT